jgi:hypothetical protein
MELAGPGPDDPSWRVGTSPAQAVEISKLSRAHAANQPALAEGKHSHYP